MRFVFATEEVGYKVSYPTCKLHSHLSAEEPRLFALDNFLTEDDASQLIEDALAISDDEHKTSKGYKSTSAWTFVSLHAIEPTLPRRQRRVDGTVSVDANQLDFHTQATPCRRRGRENAWVKDTKTAMRMKRRALNCSGLTTTMRGWPTGCRFLDITIPMDMRRTRTT